MPSHKIHKLFNKILTGKEHEDVNLFCDFIKGKNHRKKWGHDLYTPLVIYLLSHDISKANAAICHIVMDKLEEKVKYKKSI